MARPRKPTNELRTGTLAFRLTARERLEIEQAARSAGLSASEYARRQVLAGRVIVQTTHSLDRDTFDQLRRIGVNLNQIARIANQTDRIPASLPHVCATLEELLMRELGAGPVESDDEGKISGKRSPERGS